MIARSSAFFRQALTEKDNYICNLICENGAKIFARCNRPDLALGIVEKMEDTSEKISVLIEAASAYTRTSQWDDSTKLLARGESLLKELAPKQRALKRAKIATAWQRSGKATQAREELLRAMREADAADIDIFIDVLASGALVLAQIDQGRVLLDTVERLRSSTFVCEDGLATHQLEA